jgi:AraC-like DNA-binding protein
MPGARKAQILEVAPTHVWDVGVIDILFVLAQTVQLFVYVTVVAGMIRGLQERMKNSCSGPALGHIASLRSINFAFYVVVAIQLAVYADCFVTGKYVVTKDYLLTFALGVVVYAVAYAALTQPESFVRCVETTPAHHPTGPPPVELPALRERLVEHMRTREPYRRPNIRLVDLADELGVPMHHLSYVINSQFEANFNDFINRFRVEEAQRRLRHADDQKFTLVAIAEDVGFTSRTSFNRAFKKLAGTTPTEYARAFRSDAQERPSM